MVPVELDYLVVKSTTTFDMQIFCFSIKFGLNLSKNEYNFNPKAAPTESDFSVANEQKHSCYANIQSFHQNNVYQKLSKLNLTADSYLRV